MSEDRRGKMERQFLAIEAAIVAVLGVLFLIVALGKEETPGFAGLALSLLLLALLIRRASR